VQAVYPGLIPESLMHIDTLPGDSAYFFMFRQKEVKLASRKDIIAKFSDDVQDRILFKNVKFLMLEMPCLLSVKSHIRDRNNLLEIRKALTLHQERLQLCGGGIAAGGPQLASSSQTYVPDLVLEQLLAKLASFGTDNQQAKQRFLDFMVQVRRQYDSARVTEERERQDVLDSLVATGQYLSTTINAVKRERNRLDWLF
jgi:hypothetical protein